MFIYLVNHGFLSNHFSLACRLFLEPFFPRVPFSLVPFSPRIVFLASKSINCRLEIPFFTFSSHPRFVQNAWLQISWESIQDRRTKNLLTLHGLEATNLFALHGPGTSNLFALHESEAMNIFIFSYSMTPRQKSPRTPCSLGHQSSRTPWPWGPTIFSHSMPFGPKVFSYRTSFSEGNERGWPVYLTCVCYKKKGGLSLTNSRPARG